MGSKNNEPSIRFIGFNDAWEQRKLKEIGNIITGSTPSTLNDEYYSNDGMKWVTPTDIDSNIVQDTAKKLSNKGVEVARVVPENTILVTCIASIGKNAIALEKLSFNQQINSLTPNKEYNPYFLLTESFLWSNNMKKMGASGMMQMVNKTEFSELETLVPTKQEQEKIGTFFSNLDNLISLHQRKLDNLEILKKTFLDKLFPKNNDAKPLYRFNGFLDDWEQHKLKEIGNIITGSTPSTLNDEYYSNKGMKWVTPTDIESNIVQDTAKKLTNKGVEVARVVPENTILVTCIASIGKNALALEKLSFNQQINSLTPNKEYNPYFLLTESFLWSNNMKKMGASGMMQMVNKTEFSELKTSVPTKQEQDSIGNIFKELDNLITLHQRKFEHLENLKKYFLNNMFI